MSEDRVSIDLETLVGERELSGVDSDTLRVKRFDWSAEGDTEPCEVLRFVLDGVTYEAIEDPSDGYRSSMRGCYVTNTEVKNTFAPVPVLATWRTKGAYSGEDEVLELRDRANGKVILEVGTSNVDDYYPSFAAHWHPGEMAVNANPLPSEGKENG